MERSDHSGRISGGTEQQYIKDAEWLPKLEKECCKGVKPSLLAKNSNTNRPKDYRPIALPNSMYKVYTFILNYFSDDHCRVNNIIGIKQATTTRVSWDCSNQLLINKAEKENIACVWLDYKKIFDTAPDDWLIKALKLAKVLEEIIKAIESLTRTWTTKAFLQPKNVTIETESIDYRRGILQGDRQSVLLFALSINPASFIMKDFEGFELGEVRTIREMINHLLFVDDLVVYKDTTSLLQMEKLLDFVTTFTNDIGMIFGESKCAYICIVRRKKKCLGNSIVMNGLTVQELKEEEQYKYLGQDESVEYHGPLNEECYQTV